MLASLYSALPRQPELSATWNSLRQQQTVVISVADESVDETPTKVGNGQHNSCNSERIGPSPSPVKVSNGETPITPSTLFSVKRRKASRMREVEIVDPVLPPQQMTTSSAFLKPDWTMTVVTPVSEKPVTGSDDAGHLATKQRVEELRRVFGQENWLTSQAGNQVRLLLGWQEAEADPIAEAAACDDDDDDTSLPAETKEDAIVVLESERDVSTTTPVSPIDCGEGDSDDLHVFVVQRQIGDSQSEERLLTVSAAYLCEKDTLSGATLAYWKRSSLQFMTVLCPSSLSRPSVRVQLVFFPAYRSNNEPIYDMEQDDFTVILPLLPLNANCTLSFSSPFTGAGKCRRQRFVGPWVVTYMENSSSSSKRYHAHS